MINHYITISGRKFEIVPENFNDFRIKGKKAEEPFLFVSNETNYQPILSDKVLQASSYELYNLFILNCIDSQDRECVYTIENDSVEILTAAFCGNDIEVDNDLGAYKITLTIDDVMTSLDLNKGNKINLYSNIKSVTKNKPTAYFTSDIPGLIRVFDALQLLIKEATGFDLESNLYNSANYVTSAESDLRYLYITQASNVKLAVTESAFQSATIFEITLDELLNDLVTLHNIRIYFDVTNRVVRIEHVDYFIEERENLKLIDLTNFKYADGVDLKNNYKFVKEEMPKYETFNNTYYSRYFKDSQYTYPSVESKSKDVKTITHTMKGYTDIYGCALKPEHFDDNSYFFIQYNGDGIDANVEFVFDVFSTDLQTEVEDEYSKDEDSNELYYNFAQKNNQYFTIHDGFPNTTDGKERMWNLHNGKKLGKDCAFLFFPIGQISSADSFTVAVEIKVSTKFCRVPFDCRQQDELPFRFENWRVNSSDIVIGLIDRDIYNKSNFNLKPTDGFISYKLFKNSQNRNELTTNPNQWYYTWRTDSIYNDVARSPFNYVDTDVKISMLNEPVYVSRNSDKIATFRLGIQNFTVSSGSTITNAAILVAMPAVMIDHVRNLGNEGDKAISNDILSKITNLENYTFDDPTTSNDSDTFYKLEQFFKKSVTNVSFNIKQNSLAVVFNNSLRFEKTVPIYHRSDKYYSTAHFSATGQNLSLTNRKRLRENASLTPHYEDKFDPISYVHSKYGKFGEIEEFEYDYNTKNFDKLIVRYDSAIRPFKDTDVISFFFEGAESVNIENFTGRTQITCTYKQGTNISDLKCYIEISYAAYITGINFNENVNLSSEVTFFVQAESGDYRIVTLTLIQRTFQFFVKIPWLGGITPHMIAGVNVSSGTSTWISQTLLDKEEDDNYYNGNGNREGTYDISLIPPDNDYLRIQQFFCQYIGSQEMDFSNFTALTHLNLEPYTSYRDIDDIVNSIILPENSNIWTMLSLQYCNLRELDIEPLQGQCDNITIDIRYNNMISRNIEKLMYQLCDKNWLGGKLYLLGNELPIYSIYSAEMTTSIGTFEVGQILTDYSTNKNFKMIVTGVDEYKFITHISIYDRGSNYGNAMPFNLTMGNGLGSIIYVSCNTVKTFLNNNGWTLYF